MTDRERYTPGPASGARVVKEGARWTLILVRELRHSPTAVWAALTDPAQLREWAPFDADGDLARVGATVTLTWVGTGAATETRVTRVEAPRLLEYGDMRWELAPAGRGHTRLTLWHSIDRRFVLWGAAGWQIGFDVLERHLAGHPIGRIAGADAVRSDAWPRLVAEYANQFDAPIPNSSPKAARGS